MCPPSCPRYKSCRPLHAISAALHKNFVHMSESSIQRSEQSVFIVSFKLPSSTIRNPLTTGSPIESSVSCSILDQSSMGMCSLQLLCPGSSSPIQTASDYWWGMCSLQLLCPSSSSPIQTASDYWWHCHPNLQAKMSLRKCHKFVPNLRAIQQNSSHHSTHQNSSHRSIHHNSNHRSRMCQWDMSVQFSECPSLPLISSCQDLGDHLSMFCPCVSLWRLGLHFWFLWIFFCYLYSCLCSENEGSLAWTITCSVCRCLTIALPVLVGCVHSTVTSKHPSCGLGDPFPLPDERERFDRINIHGI